jgi:CheY-like chemotaxis protein
MTGTPPGPPAILVIEDDALTRRALALVLARDGFQVQTAANGRAALDQLRLGRRPSLILLDLVMPVMDGYQFRDEQRRDPLLADIPVIIVSGAFDARSRDAALQAAEYLDKPIDPTVLLETVRQHC